MAAQHRLTAKATIDIWKTRITQVFCERQSYSIDILVNTIKPVWMITEDEMISA